MSVLVDTSVWVDHFRNRNSALIALLEVDSVLSHPLVVAELACGTPPEPRLRSLRDIEILIPARSASLGEVRALIESERLYGQGCGLVDFALLASTLITPGARLWTFDKRLASFARSFDVAYGN